MKEALPIASLPQFLVRNVCIKSAIVYQRIDGVIEIGQD